MHFPLILFLLLSFLLVQEQHRIHSLLVVPHCYLAMPIFAYYACDAEECRACSWSKKDAKRQKWFIGKVHGDDCILCPPCLKKVNKATDRENRYEKQAMNWNEPEQVKAYQTLFENPAWEEEAWQVCKANLARPPLPFLLE